MNEQTVKALVKDYLGIQSRLEENALRAIREYNQTLSEMLMSLTEQYAEIKKTLSGYPDPERYDFRIHIVESNRIELEFEYDGSVIEIPVTWLTDDYEKAVEHTCKTRIEAQIKRVNQRNDKKREALEAKKASLQKEMEKVDKSLGDL